MADDENAELEDSPVPDTAAAEAARKLREDLGMGVLPNSLRDLPKLKPAIDLSPLAGQSEALKKLTDNLSKSMIPPESFKPLIPPLTMPESGYDYEADLEWISIKAERERQDHEALQRMPELLVTMSELLQAQTRAMEQAAAASADAELESAWEARLLGVIAAAIAGGALVPDHSVLSTIGAALACGALAWSVLVGVRRLRHGRR